MTTLSAERIGGWLLGPLAWLLVVLFSTSLALLMYGTALLTPQTVTMLGTMPFRDTLLWFVSFACALGIWYYTFWLVIAFFKRRRSVPKHYIVWLLISVLLAVKAFAFAPVSDELALRQLLFPLLAAALMVPYFKRSTRVKKTFINP
ncbi:Protein of unknown function [Kosakonia oryzendophytica]|uniref:DUF2569 domain-containing protein n=1 Tax=Kosakonia oryzendophytica TaxID=1005665 RepID=A0A1C4CV96_9ENTR|nr:DUF2569 domain-containing protein [Kosakonia oryzendophytica]AMO49280.1 Inner membrane protein YdgK [Enterobacter sp. FY-07]TDT59820.1 uncharacterized protein DUF2569 [Enterobacter sp. AG5470]WBT56260.1 DUF2569 domain-containing protein [Kosakonia oryzendophytica]SCC22983.1 Protein of unknown function [Kosakonia oryzendophytica]